MKPTEFDIVEFLKENSWSTSYKIAQYLSKISDQYYTPHHVKEKFLDRLADLGLIRTRVDQGKMEYNSPEEDVICTSDGVVRIFPNKLKFICKKYQNCPYNHDPSKCEYLEKNVKELEDKLGIKVELD